MCAYSPIEPEGKRGVLWILTRGKEPKPALTFQTWQVQSMVDETYQRLSVAVISPYPDAWKTPGVVSKRP